MTKDPTRHQLRAPLMERWFALPAATRPCPGRPCRWPRAALPCWDAQRTRAGRGDFDAAAGSYFAHLRLSQAETPPAAQWGPSRVRTLLRFGPRSEMLARARSPSGPVEDDCLPKQYSGRRHDLGTELYFPPPARDGGGRRGLPPHVKNDTVPFDPVHRTLS